MIEVQLLEFDRGEQKFASLEELKERIEKTKNLLLSILRKIPFTTRLKYDTVTKYKRTPKPRCLVTPAGSLV